MRTYLFAFDPGLLDRQAIIERVDRIRDIENWYAFLPGALCLVTEMDAKTLSNAIREECPDINFIVTRLDRGTKGGWLRKSVWDFMNNPEGVSTSDA